MNARVYLNSSTNSATSRIDGGGFSPPPIRAYSDVIVRFRLSREIEGEAVPDDRPILGVSARIGYQDAAPTAGTVSLDLTLGANTVTTAALAYNATAAQVATAINAALDSSALDALHPCTVESLTEGYRIIFADPSQTVTVEAATNKLWPLSFVNADLVAFDGGWSTMLAYRQTAVAETASAEITVPPIPTVIREQLGATTDGIAINEVQLIELSPSYAGGTFKLVWSGVKSGILPGFPSLDQLQTVLDALAPAGGIFNLIPIETGVLVEFAGSMAGESQALMTTEEFTPPPVEYLVKLPTDTQAMRTMMAGAGTDGEIDLPMDIRVLVDDSDAPDEEQELNFPMELNFTRPVSDGNRNVSANLDYTQPLSRTNNAPFSPNALLVGNRARRFTIGDGTATSFVLPHNLGSLTGAFTAATTDICTKTGHNLHNGDPVTLSTTGTLPAGLSAGGTYFIVSATTDTFKLSLTPGGAAIDITSAGTGTHTVTVADGTTDVVFVEVWEAAGLMRRVSPEDYTVAITTADSITVSAFASTPTAGQYRVIVQTAGRPATYQAHTHTIPEVSGLQAALDAVNARLLALESRIASGPARVPISTISGVFATWRPDPVQIAYPLSTKRRALLTPWPAQIKGLLAFKVGTKPLIRPRVGSLLPAVHDAAAENLSTLTPAFPALGNYVGRVFENNTGTTKAVPGRGGRATDYCLAGEHLACDGNAWYVVEKQESRTGPNPLPSTSEPPTTWAVAESTWYPRQFVQELFCFPVSASLLGLRRIFDFPFALEAALLAANTKAQVVLELRFGQRASATTPGTPGENLEEINWADPSLVQRIELSGQSVVHPFGIRVTREVDAGSESGDRLTCIATAYGLEEIVAPPASAEFWVQARILNFDVLDAPASPVGLLAIAGLAVPAGYSSARLAEGEFGAATVSR